jgi:2-(1,2-epoxy-1,2-dihydrophenyl)acetyl-CoA isomerase
VYEALERIVEAGPVLVGAINGPATGADLGLVCACDLAYARLTAAIRSGFSRLGLSPDAGTTWSLPRRVGARNALKILLSPDPLSAPAALALYDEVIDAADEAVFLEAVLLRTRGLLATAGATRATRRLLRDSECRSQ